MTEATTPQSTDPLERLSKALEELKNSDVAALGRAFRLMEDRIGQQLMEVQGKVDAIGDWIQSREAERAPGMQRQAPSPPPSKQEGPDFEAIGWYTGSGPNRKPAAKGADGWGFAQPNPQYDSRDKANLKLDLVERVQMGRGKAEVSMGGYLFEVDDGKDGRYFNRKRVLEGGRR